MLFIRRSVSFSLVGSHALARMQVAGEEERDAQNTNTGDCTTRQPNSRRSEEFETCWCHRYEQVMARCDVIAMNPSFRSSSSVNKGGCGRGEESEKRRSRRWRSTPNSFYLSPFLLLLPFLFRLRGLTSFEYRSCTAVAFRWSEILLTLLRFFLCLRGNDAGSILSGQYGRHRRHAFIGCLVLG